MAGGGGPEEPAERPAPPAAPRPSRASLLGCPKGGGRGGGPGRSRARRCAVPGRRPPRYTQHVNRARREEPRDRREPAPPVPAASPPACGAARCPPGRRAPEERGGRAGGRRRERAAGGARRLRERRARRARMDFQQLADVAEKWCSNTPFELIATEETERRMDFYADPGVSFYVLCPDNDCGDNFVSAWGRDRCSARECGRAAASLRPSPGTLGRLCVRGRGRVPNPLATAHPAARPGKPRGPARRGQRSGWGRLGGGQGRP